MVDLQKFSVVVSVYYQDDPVWLKRALDSIINQTVIPDEIILVVDGTIGDNLKKTINSYSKLNLLKIIRLKVNRGLGYSRHKAILHSNYGLIAFMDADDISVTNRFEQQLQIFKKMKVDVVGGLIEEFGKDSSDSSLIRHLPQKHKDIVSFGKWRNPVNHVTVMLKKDAYFKVGGYKPIRDVEDYDLFVRMIQNGSKFYNLQYVLVLVRGGDSYYSRRGGKNILSSEISLFLKMHKTGYLSKKQMIINIFIRIFTRHLPSKIMIKLYKIFLRR